MPTWQLSIQSPTIRVHLTRRGFARQGPMAAASGALGLTLILGWIAPAPMLDASLTLIGMASVAGLGLLAYLFARLTVTPLADPRDAALAAALVPSALFPGIGLAAFTVPAILAPWLLWKRPSQRVVALMVQCAALLALTTGGGGDAVNHFVVATTLCIALFFILNRLDGSANDNPSMERMGGESRLPPPRHYGRSGVVPDSGSGEYHGNVQQ